MQSRHNVSIMATDYTDGLAMKAVKLVFENLPSAYENGANDPKAREEMANASCMAGMAFANAFLGVNHSMAHKLGAFHHLPHGVANAVILTEVMRYNAAEVPNKDGNISHSISTHMHLQDTQNSDVSQDAQVKMIKKYLRTSSLSLKNSKRRLESRRQSKITVSMRSTSLIHLMKCQSRHSTISVQELTQDTHSSRRSKICT